MRRVLRNEARKKKQEPHYCKQFAFIQSKKENSFFKF